MQTNPWPTNVVDEVAATIAVPDLVRTSRTWGDLMEQQKERYRDDARATLAVVTRHLGVEYQLPGEGLILEWEAELLEDSEPAPQFRLKSGKWQDVQPNE